MPTEANAILLSPDPAEVRRRVQALESSLAALKQTVDALTVRVAVLEAAP